MSCKGLIFRCNVTRYLSINITGAIEVTETIRLRWQKRMSCSGCAKCKWFFKLDNADLKANGQFIKDPQHGKLYAAVRTAGGIRFREVVPSPE